MADIETPAWRCKHKVGNLMKRVISHANGEIEMTSTQLAAAKLYLSKTLPDVSKVEHSGDKENPIKHSMVVEIVK